MVCLPQLEERERQAKAEFAARMSKLNQVELKRKKEEDIAVCYVCNSGDHVEKQEDIVFCERCCVAVHMSCYNAEEVGTCRKDRLSRGSLLLLYETETGFSSP